MVAARPVVRGTPFFDTSHLDLLNMSCDSLTWKYGTGIHCRLYRVLGQLIPMELFEDVGSTDDALTGLPILMGSRFPALPYGIHYKY